MGQYKNKRQQILDRIITMFEGKTQVDEDLVITHISLTLGANKNLIQEILQDARKIGVIK